MATETSERNYIKLTRDPLGVLERQQIDISNRLMSNRELYSLPERERILGKIQHPMSTGLHAGKHMAASQYSLASYAQYISQTLSSSREENERIIKMSPEIAQAIEVVIASVISPNDMTNSGIPIVVEDNDVSSKSDICADIAKHLNEFFNDRLKIRGKIGKWLMEALYKAGAKPILILPISELDRKFNDPNEVNVSNESYLNEVRKTSLYGIADSEYDDNNRYGDVSNLIASMESFADHINKLEPKSDDNDSKSKPSYNGKEQVVNKNEILKFISKESLEILDNPDVIKATNNINNKRKRKERKYTTVAYKTRYIESIEVPDKDTKVLDNPLMMEVAYDAIMPIYLPNDPAEHLGYICVIDEFGNPLSTTIDTKGSANTTGGNNTIDSIFRAYGINNMRSANTPSSYRVAASMYQEVMRSHLENRLSNAGYNGLKVGGMNNIYQYMFNKYLEGRLVRLLYVPAELVVYIHDDVGPNGQGESYLESSKFILSIYTGLMISYALSAIRSAANHQKLSIDLTNSAEAGKDPVAIMDKLVDSWINKNSMSLTTDPHEFVRNLTRKSITVEAKGIPGMDNLNVETSNVDKGTTNIDNDYLTSLRKSLGMSQHIPSHILDSQSDEGFSRGIATTNLLFSLFISDVQVPISEHLTKLVRTYVRYSDELQKFILQKLGILNEDEVNSDIDKSDPGSITKKAKTKKITVNINGNQTISSNVIPDSKFDEPKVPDLNTPLEGTPNIEDAKESIARALEVIIDSIHVKFPKPDMAPSTTQFESLGQVVDGINRLVDSVYSDELLAGDSESVEAMQAIRAMVKMRSILDYISKSGINSIIDIKENDVINNDEIVTYRRKIANVHRMIKDVSAMFKGDATDGEDGQSEPDNAWE